MKRIVTALFLFLAFCQWGISQRSYIIAGQTDSMIYTSFVPACVVIPTGNSTSQEADAGIDLNHDGIYDLSYHFYWRRCSPSCSLDTTAIIPLVNLYVSCTLDTTTSEYFSCPTGYLPVAKTFLSGDTLSNLPTDLWQNGFTTISWEQVDGDGYYYCKLNTNQPSTAIYYFVKMIANGDTLLGYIHMHGDSIFDYAIQGPQSVYIVSGIKEQSAMESSKIYPVPCHNQLTIQAADYLSYNLYDIAGRMMLFGSSKIINTENLVPGPYFLMLETRNGSIFKQVFKVE
jgi:hypothetical protein